MSESGHEAGAGIGDTTRVRAREFAALALAALVYLAGYLAVDYANIFPDEFSFGEDSVLPATYMDGTLGWYGGNPRGEPSLLELRDGTGRRIGFRCMAFDDPAYADPIPCSADAMRGLAGRQARIWYQERYLHEMWGGASRLAVQVLLADGRLYSFAGFRNAFLRSQARPKAVSYYLAAALSHGILVVVIWVVFTRRLFFR